MSTALLNRITIEPGKCGGNCRKPELIKAIDSSLEQIEAAFASGQRIVEIA